jgi:hypothetical protein
MARTTAPASPPASRRRSERTRRKSSREPHDHRAQTIAINLRRCRLPALRRQPKPATPPDRFSRLSFCTRRTFPQASGGEFGRTFVQVLWCFHLQSTGTRSDSLEAMSIVGTESGYSLAEGPGVVLWRFQRSLEMGFEGRLADRIAVSQIDLHQLERLISSGCPPGTAYRILRP